LAKGTFSGKIVIVDLPAQEYRLAGQMAALARFSAATHEQMGRIGGIA